MTVYPEFKKLSRKEASSKLENTFGKAQSSLPLSSKSKEASDISPYVQNVTEEEKKRFQNMLSLVPIIPTVVLDGVTADLAMLASLENSNPPTAHLTYYVRGRKLRHRIQLYLGCPSPTPEPEDVTNPGYHLSPIPKGVYGEASKIVEEVLEFKDALEQGCEIMGLLELADLVGAIKAYLKKNVGYTIQDLETMSDITERAFRNGHRG